MVQCVYCGHTKREELMVSFLVPDDTVYPGVQLVCSSVDACLLRIHQIWHRELAAPECRYCEWSPLPVKGSS